MTNIRLLALDLDGTLLGADSRVPQENARAVRLAQEAGVQVALCTGRNHTEVLTFNSQLEQSADWAVIANGAAVVDEMTAALKKTGRFELSPSVMYGGALKNVELNRRGVHKGAALEKLCAALGISMEAVMAMGDSDNDRTMVELSGLGVAMGNAQPSLMAVADAVTGANTDCGVAQAIRQYCKIL